LAAVLELCWPAWLLKRVSSARRFIPRWSLSPCSHHKLRAHGWSSYCAKAGRCCRAKLLPRPLQPSRKRRSSWFFRSLERSEKSLSQPELFGRASTRIKESQDHSRVSRSFAAKCFVKVHPSDR